MKTVAFYFIAVCIASMSCKPIHRSIGKREVYKSPNISSFKLKTFPSLNTMLQVADQVFYINTDTVIYGSKGTVISIQPLCLRTSNSVQSIIQETFVDFKNDESYLSETAKEVQTYLFSTKNFGWINCDRFYDDSRVKTDLLDMFVLPDQEKNITETYNYSVFDSLISVLPINLDDSGQ